jgi:hypothetical protein
MSPTNETEPAGVSDEDLRRSVVGELIIEEILSRATADG